MTRRTSLAQIQSLLREKKKCLFENEKRKEEASLIVKNWLYWLFKLILWYWDKWILVWNHSSKNNGEPLWWDLRKFSGTSKEREIINLEGQKGAAQVSCIADFPDNMFLVKGLGYGSVLGWVSEKSEQVQSCDRYSLCGTMALFRLNFNLTAKIKYQKVKKQGALRLYFQVNQYLSIKLLFWQCHCFSNVNSTLILLIMHFY